MVKFKDEVATMPISEFRALDPEYWDKSNDKYYTVENTVLEASKRNQRKKTEKKDGDIFWCDFDLKNHAIRPGLILFMNGIKPIICTISSTDKRADWQKHPNVEIARPLKKGNDLLKNRSHVSVNKFRYVKDPEIEILGKIGEVQPENLKEIKKRFYETNFVKGELVDDHPALESLLLDDDMESLLEDLD